MMASAVDPSVRQLKKQPSSHSMHSLETLTSVEAETMEQSVIGEESECNTL